MKTLDDFLPEIEPRLIDDFFAEIERLRSHIAEADIRSGCHYQVHYHVFDADTDAFRLP